MHTLKGLLNCTSTKTAISDEIERRVKLARIIQQSNRFVHHIARLIHFFPKMRMGGSEKDKKDKQHFPFYHFNVRDEGNCTKKAEAEAVPGPAKSGTGIYMKCQTSRHS